MEYFFYIGFALWFCAGYSRGKYVANKNRLKDKIKRS